MKKRFFAGIILSCFILLAISGCGTVPKKFKEEVGGIKTRVETLESRVEGVESKQADVERVAGEQTQALDELKTRRARTNIGVKSRHFKSKEGIKDVQLCLKNAGFYDGEIDGIKGKRTRKAIREFQGANGLTADGIVGKKTWELLAKYAQGASGGAEEGAAK